MRLHINLATAVKSILHSAFVVLILLPCLQAGESEEKYRELLAPAPRVSDSENAWLIMKDLPPFEVSGQFRRELLMVFPEEATADKKAGVDRKVLNAHLEANAKLLELGKEVLKRRGWNRPYRTNFQKEDDSFLGFSSFLRRTMMEMTISFSTAQEGRVFTGWSSLMAEMKFDQQISNSGGTVLDTLVASAMLRLGARYAGWIGQMATDAKTAKEFAGNLLAFEELEKPLAATLKGEFNSGQNTFLLCRAGGEPLKRTVVEYQLMTKKFRVPSATDAPQSEVSQEETVDSWMENPPPAVLADIEAIKKFDFDALQEESMKEYGEAISKPAATWVDFRKNFPDYGSSLIDLANFKATFNESLQASLNEKSITVPALYKVLFTTLAQVRLARIGLLVKAWQLDHAGELPESLQQLVPEYLDAVPTDPFDGHPLRYDKKARKLWSESKSLADKNHQLEEILQILVE